MRVLFVTDFYHPYSGGVEIHVRTVATELAARGHEVAVATMATPDGEPERDRDGPISVFTVGHSAARIGLGFSHQHRPWAPPAPDPVAMRELRAVVRAFEPEVIHGHDWLARSVLPTVVSGRIPVVTSLHYYTRTCAKKTLWRDGRPCEGPRLGRCLPCAGRHYGPLRGTAVTLGLRLGSALEDRRTARWISVSAATAAGNRLLDRDGSVVIANPLRHPPDHPGPVTDLVPDGPFILFVGDIRPEKGLAVLAGAVDRLRASGDRTPLVVVGERMSSEVALPEGTVETGPVPHDQVQALWARATVGVVPSLWPEPFGLVAIEALSAGCPLIASDIGGLAEIGADRRARLVPPGDAPALAGALTELLTDGEARAELAERGRQAAKAYELGPIVDAVEAEYRLALATGPAGGR